MHLFPPKHTTSIGRLTPVAVLALVLMLILAVVLVFPSPSEATPLTRRQILSIPLSEDACAETTPSCDGCGSATPGTACWYTTTMPWWESNANSEAPECHMCTIY
ncbi:hypothetical protein M427DRAFT_58492 [Gonapodya prolifera JEL478]|uniref:CBM1 domain-containing protein n=1 Tax=Gonapodya prolifera (strain JEL478) TaxID=1344416 RepID=A0A139AAF1_GONPJ|nr:hypothetical protein M427DRAFT_58492 [Gonapodya prolifera JEL478]|eukprot:KXS13678.1 hypothetical protein M427DRAFT_58492 [Gonapodya prolifera JEL478]